MSKERHKSASLSLAFNRELLSLLFIAVAKYGHSVYVNLPFSKHVRLVGDI